MSEIEKNLLSPLNYVFQMDRAPNVVYQAQRVSIPGYNLGSINFPSPFVKIPVAGNINFDDLQMQFKVGENMTNYLEFFNWMESMGRPDSLDQYRGDIRSDCKVLILNSAKRPILTFKFINAYPVGLSPLEFDSTLTDVQYLTAMATIKFERFHIEPIND